MAATKDDIISWFQEGVKNKKDFLIVVCDTFDWDDYPIFTKGDANFEKQYVSHNEHNMQKIMEVYDLHKNMKTQLAEDRSFHYPKAFKEKYNL